MRESEGADGGRVMECKGELGGCVRGFRVGWGWRVS